MKKKIVLISILGTTTLVSFVALTSALGHPKSFFKTLANKGVNNFISLSEQKISDRASSFNEEISSTVYTSSNNPIEIKCANVIDYESGWQTILPNGYFYNPLNNSTHHNKITGLTSVRFNSEGNSNLSICYGYTLDDQNIMYSYEKELVPNTDYSFDDLNPSYFYVKNNNNTNVDVISFNISYSCEEVEYPKQDLNILMIGNSFADDTVFYSERVAASYGINLHLYDAYIAGCTLNTHYSNLTNNNATYSMRSVSYYDGDYKWIYNDNMSLSSIINSHTWDIITFQQASAEVGRSSSYSNLSNLVNAVRSLVGPTPKFYWHQTWAYDSDYNDWNDYFAYFNNDQIAMYNAINSCYTNQVAPLGVFEKLIPAGTAVQNLRTSYMKETFSRDGKHMSSVHGRYLLSLDFISQVYDIDFSKSPCSYLPYEVDSSFTKVAYESIKNAQKNPLNFTNSLYPTRELANYDLSQYTEIDAELVGCSYWNSTDSSYYGVRQSNVKDSSNYYTSTKRFTQEELPIGSLVVIDDSFGVRPEAWTSDSAQYSRPNETYANVIEIDSNFWSGYQYRAFNIFKAGKTELKGQYSQIFDGFHIYVPDSEMTYLTPKSANLCYAIDRDIFLNNDFNIDYYERMHIDPITGFYKCDDSSCYDLTNKYTDDTAKKFVCTRPFYSANNDLPEGTVLILDNGYQWRSDCWDAYGDYSPRPSSVTAQFSVLDSSFWNGFRRRTFNVSNGSYVNQNYVDVLNHFRIYTPIANIPDTPVSGISLSQNSLSLFTGGSQKLSATITPLYATNKNVIWTSNNTSVATVDNDGTVHAVGVGEATITVTSQDGGYTDTCFVSVAQTIQNYPSGTFNAEVSFSGNINELIISIGTQFNGLLAARLGGTNLYPQSVSVDNSTNEVSIQTYASYVGYQVGTISGIFDPNNNEITNISFSGPLGEQVTNNGSIIAYPAETTSNTFFADCDGTTQELQAQFKRRYMSGSWQVDNSNADRFTSNTTEFVSGTGSVKRRGYGSGAVSLNLNNDFASPKTVSNIHFWVYNPSNSDINMRMWGYRETGLKSNFEIEASPRVANANSWTYIALYFGSYNIYNFQIADFTNSGVYMSFDNIYIF